MLFRTSLLALTLSLTSLSPITSAYGSNLAVDDELREAVEKVKSKCAERFPKPTEQDWQGVENLLQRPIPHELHFLFDQLNAYLTKSRELSRIHAGTASKFVHHNLDAYRKGLPLEWIAFCYDNADYHCYHSSDKSVTIWNPYEEEEERFVETLPNLTTWILKYLYPQQLKG